MLECMKIYSRWCTRIYFQFRHLSLSSNSYKIDSHSNVANSTLYNFQYNFQQNIRYFHTKELKKHALLCAANPWKPHERSYRFCRLLGQDRESNCRGFLHLFIWWQASFSYIQGPEAAGLVHDRAGREMRLRFLREDADKRGPPASRERPAAVYS